MAALPLRRSRQFVLLERFPCLWPAKKYLLDADDRIYVFQMSADVCKGAASRSIGSNMFLSF